MSLSTLLTGYVEFKKGKTYDEVKEAIHYFCKYSEVDEPDIIEQYDDYLKNFRHRTNGAHIITFKDIIKLDIQDINWASYRNENTINILKFIVAKYNDLIGDVDFSLYYLEEYNEGLRYNFYSKEYTIDDLITDLINDVAQRKSLIINDYLDELVKDNIIDEKIVMLYNLRKNEGDD